jgi:hypothetical protein
MTPLYRAGLPFLVLIILLSLPARVHGQEEEVLPAEDFLRWSVSHCEAVGKAMYVKGRVGGFFGYRGLKTERAGNYKLSATWLTPDVIRATARQIQLRSRLSDEQARALVREAELPLSAVMLIELDPREGSGVIPHDWEAFLGPKRRGGSPSTVRGTNTPELREIRALSGVLRRNYDYDRFWLVFPLQRDDGISLFAPTDTEAELLVRIENQEGRVSWPIPQSVRRTFK